MNSTAQNKITYAAEPFIGRKIGSSFMARTGWQVVAKDSVTGKRRYVFASGAYNRPTPCKKLGWVGCHYSSGRSTKDEATYQEMEVEAIKLAAELNAKA